MKRKHSVAVRAWCGLAILGLAMSGCAQWPFARGPSKADKDDKPAGWSARQRMLGATGFDPRAREIEHNLDVY